MVLFFPYLHRSTTLAVADSGHIVQFARIRSGQGPWRQQSLLSGEYDESSYVENSSQPSTIFGDVSLSLKTTFNFFSPYTCSQIFHTIFISVKLYLN